MGREDSGGECARGSAWRALAGGRRRGRDARPPPPAPVRLAAAPSRPPAAPHAPRRAAPGRPPRSARRRRQRSSWAPPARRGGCAKGGTRLHGARSRERGGGVRGGAVRRCFCCAVVDGGWTRRTGGWGTPRGRPAALPDAPRVASPDRLTPARVAAAFCVGTRARCCCTRGWPPRARCLHAPRAPPRHILTRGAHPRPDAPHAPPAPTTTPRGAAAPALRDFAAFLPPAPMRVGRRHV